MRWYLKTNGLTLSVILCSLSPSFAQQQDTTSSVDPSIFSIKTDSVTGLKTLRISARPGTQQPTIVTRGNISIAVYGSQLSFIENQIADLESEECTALQQRDRQAIQRLWNRDFTLETKQAKVVTSDNPLPNYLSFTRLIERIIVIDSNTVFTSGYETYQEFTDGVNTTPLSIRKYFHAWSRTNGLWKLATKRTNTP